MSHKSNPSRKMYSTFLVLMLSLLFMAPMLALPLGFGADAPAAVPQQEPAETQSYAPQISADDDWEISFEDEWLVFSRSLNEYLKPSSTDPGADEPGLTEPFNADYDPDEDPMPVDPDPDEDPLPADPDPDEAPGDPDLGEDPIEPDPYVSTPVDYVLYISANSLNLRAGPSLDSEIVAKLKFGDKVRCQGENAEWMQVLSGDTVGYLKTEYTSRTMVFQSVSETVYVKSNTLNLRSGPSTNDGILQALKKNDKLTRTGIGDGWSRVKTTAGKVGYVASDYLTKTAPYVAPIVKTGTGTTYSGDAGRIVELAYSALGVKYVSGGASMSGFDCSGLTSWAYKQIGITIPRSTSGYYSAGVGVSYANIKPGDILCMDTRSSDGITSITHVGIYIGKMIHASSRLGKVVIQDVKQYLSWGVKLITVRRFLNG
jgi:cell wall-associated NlpC family hydrolase